MELIQTAEGFKAAIQSYLQTHHMSAGRLAKKLGRPRTTVEWWCQHGITKEKVRRQIQEQYPWLFDLTLEVPSPQVHPAPPTSVPAANAEHFVLTVKTERAHEMVILLMATLEWFLFKATASDREHFRDALGKSWERFLELTRAMTNEKAFEIAREAGGLR